MAKHLRPRLAGTLDGIVSQGVVTLLVVSGTAIASWYQGVLKAQHQAGVHLGFFGSAIAGLPPLLVVALAAIFVFVVTWVALMLARRVGQTRSPERINPKVTTGLVSGHEANFSELQDKLAQITRERDDLLRDLQAAKANPPIYYEQTLELPQFDPRRFMLNQTTEVVRRLNPLFFNVDELEQIKVEVAVLKKDNTDSVKSMRDQYESQIDALLKACAETEQERDTAQAQLREARAVYDKPHFSHQTIRLKDLVEDGAVLRDKTFDDCTFKGPAILHPVTGIKTESLHFTNLNGKLFITIPEELEQMMGSIFVRDTTFRRCTFNNVWIAANTEESTSELKKELGFR